MILIIKLSFLCKKETVMFAFYIDFDFDFVLIDIFYKRLQQIWMRD